MRRGSPILESPSTVKKLVRRLREGIYVTDREGAILDANPAFLEMFGVASLEELAEYPAELLVVDPGRRKLEREIIERDGSVRDFELTLRRPDGETRTVLDTGFSVEEEGGDTLYYGMLIDITRRKELERELSEQVIRDPLTGCFNRRYLGSLADEVDSTEDEWGVVVLDIDHFKGYNDLHGHQAGDEILVKMSRFLMHQVRAEDAVIRYGGDEFLLFLRGSGPEMTATIGSRLEEEAPKRAPVPFSLGSANRRGGESLEKTVGRADQKLIRIRFDVRSFDRPRRSDRN